MKIEKLMVLGILFVSTSSSPIVRKKPTENKETTIITPVTTPSSTKKDSFDNNGKQLKRGEQYIEGDRVIQYSVIENPHVYDFPAKSEQQRPTYVNPKYNGYNNGNRFVGNNNYYQNYEVQRLSDLPPSLQEILTSVGHGPSPNQNYREIVFDPNVNTRYYNQNPRRDPNDPVYQIINVAESDSNASLPPGVAEILGKLIAGGSIGQ